MQLKYVRDIDRVHGIMHLHGAQRSAGGARATNLAEYKAGTCLHRSTDPSTRLPDYNPITVPGHCPSEQTTCVLFAAAGPIRRYMYVHTRLEQAALGVDAGVDRFRCTVYPCWIRSE